MATKKKATRSADAAASAAAIKAKAKAKATGQTKTSSMDAITRRYKAEGNGVVKDRRSGVSTQTATGYKWIDDRKTAAKAGGLTKYAAARSADKRAGIESSRLGGRLMSAEAKKYESKFGTGTKKASPKKTTKRPRPRP